ncbi:MAG: glutamyl-tRNA reductase [Deltaproteobacteria bacterium]|nr:glutamyl-tRNA reductase [Deltaproteobacteria bacterium]
MNDHLIIAGVNFKTASLKQMAPVSALLSGTDFNIKNEFSKLNISETATVLTCNRIEIYAVADDTESTISNLTDWFVETSKGTLTEENIYTYKDMNAAQHLFTVACGLDSMIIGETEITGQLRMSIDDALKKGTAAKTLTNLFNHAFKTSNRARNETAIDKGVTSVAAAAVHLGERVMGELANRSCLVIGAGKTGEQLVCHLLSNGAKVVIANRTVQRAEVLAGRTGASFSNLENLKELIKSADITFTATASSNPLISKNMIEEILKGHHSIVQFIDVSNPPNIEQEIKDVPNIILNTLDDINSITSKSIKKREGEAKIVNEIIKQEVELYNSRKRIIKASPLIKQLRDSVEQLRLDELEKQRKRLDDNTFKELEQITSSMFSKVLHWPTVAIREIATESGNNDQDFELVKKLFGLNRTEIERQQKK